MQVVMATPRMSFFFLRRRPPPPPPPSSSTWDTHAMTRMSLATTSVKTKWRINWRHWWLSARSHHIVLLGLLVEHTCFFNMGWTVSTCSSAGDECNSVEGKTSHLNGIKDYTNLLPMKLQEILRTYLNEQASECKQEMPTRLLCSTLTMGHF